MNYEIFNINKLILEKYEVKDVLSCLIHTILFNRILTVMTPVEVKCDNFDITYYQHDSIKIIDYVDERIDKFFNNILDTGTNSGDLNLGFYEKVSSSSWFTGSTDKIYWEKWCFPIVIENQRYIDNETRNQKHRNTKEYIVKTLHNMLDILQTKKNHIPPIKNNQSFELSFTKETNSLSKILTSVKSLNISPFSF